MAMQIEKAGIKLAAIYRPLNNVFLNLVMEKIRKRYICKTQIKKGIGGLKQLLKFSNEGYSTALMIDQRVSQGIKSNFFNEKAFTTTIPAQLIKKCGGNVYGFNFLVALEFLNGQEKLQNHSSNIINLVRY